LLEIENSSRGPELILTRASPKFVRRLFELEVTEIADGTVKIEAFAREPGYRTKIAVSTTDPKVDPVGACVGARGARVKSIVRELGGEKIDIVRYFSDPREMVAEALKPAILRNIVIDEKNRRVAIVVSEEDLAIAIGKKGQNARLTSRLIGWKIDIMKLQTVPTTLEQKKGLAASGLAKIPGIEETIAQRLVAAGFASVELFDGVESGDLVEAGFTAEEADDILKKVAAHAGIQK
jgi:N utilization substance protein A